MALPYGIETLDIIAFLSEWGSLKKCLASITHKYAYGSGKDMRRFSLHPSIPIFD